MWALGIQLRLFGLVPFHQPCIDLFCFFVTTDEGSQGYSQSAKDFLSKCLPW
ncbi:hypothetical protein I79_022662 [Cricetulus griseus]|uniref:Uncharacterized protein n=1 Tax=Cricetulus griseus TaxID=10029 RepID=G3IFY6_CRIGR|nr:hypothetical protein I79_022662 [Cricetulus griseus]